MPIPGYEIVEGGVVKIADKLERIKSERCIVSRWDSLLCKSV